MHGGAIEMDYEWEINFIFMDGTEETLISDEDIGDTIKDNQDIKWLFVGGKNGHLRIINLHDVREIKIDVRSN